MELDNLPKLHGRLKTAFQMDGETLQNGFLQILRDVKIQLGDRNQPIFAQMFPRLRGHVLVGEPHRVDGGAGLFRL